MARHAAENSAKWYFVIFLALAAAAGVVSTSELVGSSARVAQLMAFIFAAVAVISLWVEFRAAAKTSPQYITRAACSMDERPADAQHRNYPV